MDEDIFKIPIQKISLEELKKLYPGKETQEMEPGREMDALVAERVFGIKEIRVIEAWDKVKNTHKIEFPDIPCYSSDIAAAWEVVEKVNKDLTFEIHVNRENVCGVRYDCVIWTSLDDKICVTSSISAAHAICQAALKAVGAL